MKEQSMDDAGKNYVVNNDGIKGLHHLHKRMLESKISPRSSTRRLLSDEDKLMQKSPIP
jgi:hypothetical protein